MRAIWSRTPAWLARAANAALGQPPDAARGRGPAARAALLPAALALTLILAAGLFTERLLAAAARTELRETVRVEADAIRARLDVALGERLRALAVIEGELIGAAAPDPAAFEALTAGVLVRDPVLRAVAARLSPGRATDSDGATLINPARDPAAPALAALLAGPQTGLAALGLAAPGAPAILLAAGSGAGPRAAAALDLQALYDIAVRDAGGARGGPALDLALTVGRPGAPPLLVGDARALSGDPVALDLAFAAATVRLAAAPAAGWTVEPRAVWLIRLITVVSAGLIVGPMLRTRRFAEERQRHIADLHDRETQLLRLSRRLGLALDASKVGVWDYDIEGGALVWDDRMDELYGLPRDGRARVYADWRDRLHPEDLGRAEDEFRAAIEDTGRYNSDYRLVLPGGDLRHIRAIGAVFADPGGARRILGVNWDVTAEVRRRAELDARRREAEAASIAKSQFLATMSHEIRTPMSGVLGMLDLVLRSDLAPEARTRAEIACDSARHLLAILNDILEFSRLEAHSVALEPAPVNLRALVRDVAALLSAAAEERGVALAARVDNATPDWLTCDPTRLRQVLLNLVGNAIKFTDAGRVDIAVGYLAHTGGGVLDAAVRDTGVGIPEEDRARLFQRFVQVDSSSARRRGGAGLGLAISRQLVELMGGEIDVESAPGRGSTFRFWVPTAPCEAPEAAADAPAPCAGEPAAPALRVLLAEDNATNQHILAAYLTQAGHSVRIVGDGAETLAALAGEPFDLVLMDIQMPGMDGLTATRRIRALPGAVRSIPIVALTANAMQGDREACLATGMSDYVSKPVAPDALHAAIARVTRPPTARCA